MDLDEYQRAAAGTDIRPDPREPLPLLGLAGEVGSLVTEYKKRLRAGEMYSGFADEVREDLGDLMWYAATLARTLGLTLSDIAAANLAKTAAIWGDQLQPPSRFAVAVGSDGLPRAKMYLGATEIGDPLDDNAYEEDHYRFHDAFHLAYAAVLGWSPVIRRLMKRKRKSAVAVDRVEDGARANVLEEGLAAFVFSEASSHAFFDGATQVDWDLLKTARRMVRHLEVGDQTPNAWRSAILQGYAVWRDLRAHDGGLVTADLDQRTLRWEPASA